MIPNMIVVPGEESRTVGIGRNDECDVGQGRFTPLPRGAGPRPGVYAAFTPDGYVLRQRCSYRDRRVVHFSAAAKRMLWGMPFVDHGYGAEVH